MHHNLLIEALSISFILCTSQTNWVNNVKFRNHKNSQGVNPDNTIKTERFGCVYTGNEGNNAA